MKHLVFTISNGFVEFRMGDRMGSHPIAEDSTDWIINYLRKIIPHDSFEIIE